jgi:uncharacterized protein
MHPNERLLRREYDARAQRDDASLAALLTEAVVWHVPGRSAISGEYRGRDEVMEYVRRRRDLAADTFEITVRDVLVNDEHGLVIASGRAKRRGKPVEWLPTACIGSRTARSPNAGCSQRTKTVFDEIWPDLSASRHQRFGGCTSSLRSPARTRTRHAARSSARPTPPSSARCTSTS